jgi:hypothetical protein
MDVSRGYGSCDQAKHQQASILRLNIFRTQDPDAHQVDGRRKEEMTRALEAV